MAGSDSDGDKDSAESFGAIIKKQIETLKKEMGDGSDML